MGIIHIHQIKVGTRWYSNEKDFVLSVSLLGIRSSSVISNFGREYERTWHSDDLGQLSRDLSA